MGRRFARLAVIVLMTAALVVTGCTKKSEQTATTPKVKPPVIAKAGILRAAVDLSYPPFGGRDGGVSVGLDIDVAAALADRLGLTLEIVDVKAANIPAALESGKADIALGALAVTDAALSSVSSAGTYLIDGPAIFSSDSSASAETSDTTVTASATETSGTVDVTRLVGLKVGVQKNSVGYWRLADDYGEDFVTSYATLREAFRALSSGEVDVVVGDAAVGMYLSRDFTRVTYAGQYGAGAPLSVSVAADATKLADTIRASLDALASDGVLDTIHVKWTGETRSLEATGSSVNE